MKKKDKKEKKTLKERLSFGDVEIPGPLRTQTIRIYMIAAGVLVAGTAFLILSFDLFVLISIIVLALGISLLAYIREYKVSHQGYLTIDGVCESIDYTIMSQTASAITQGKTADTPSRYLIGTEMGIIAIPYFKQNVSLGIGDQVRMYFKNNVNFVEIRGANVPDSLLGYELIWSGEGYDEAGDDEE